MKRIRIISLAAAILMVLPLLFSCGEKGKVAVSFRDAEISDKEFCYYTSTYKGMFLASLGTTTDDPAYWAQMLNDKVSVGDYVGLLAANEIMSYAVLLGLFDEYGLTLSDDEVAAVDTAINGYISAAGGKAALNSSLAKYAVDSDILRDIKLDAVRMAKVQEYMHGEGDVVNATDEDYESYFNDTYYRTKYIFISSQKDYVRETDGSLSKNEDGSYKTRDITDTEKAEKASLVDELKGRIEGGEDFEALLSEYTMDVGMLHFADGYYYNGSSDYVEPTLRTALAEAEIGELIKVETTSGWYLAKRYELEAGAWQKEENAPMFTTLKSTVATLKLQEYISTFAEEVSIDDGILEEYPLAYCTPNFNY